MGLANHFFTASIILRRTQNIQPMTIIKKQIAKMPSAYGLSCIEMKALSSESICGIGLIP
jgi:hypothetical protein